MEHPAEIIPAINSEIFSDITHKIEQVKDHVRWIHIDVADGTFTENSLWHDPKELKEYLAEHPELRVEVHLMIENPEASIDEWLATGIKRVIIHVETMKNFAALKQKCDRAKVFLMLAVGPEADVHALDPYLDKNVVGFQILAVHPGLPGQLFMDSAYDKIKYIREKCSWCDIEIDGGIKTGVAKKCRQAGANMFVAASEIFNAESIERGIEDLEDDIDE